MIEFKYKERLKLGPRDYPYIVKQPNAVVKVFHEGNAVSLDMIIDSGADVTLIPKEIGEDLGFEIESEREIKTIAGIGGTIPIVYRELELRIGSEKFTAEVGWALEEGVIPILGRKDVFDRFHIEFLQDVEVVRFRKIKK